MEQDRASCNVCIHKGLYPPATTKQFPALVHYADVRDVAKAAKDWPQLNFVIYHSAFRYVGGAWAAGWTQFEQTGRVDWVTDLAEIPAKYGVTNVYGDLGQIFAESTVAEPRLCAAMMGTLVKGLGWDHVVWGTDAVWTGSPQWQIEGLRRLEIPPRCRSSTGSLRSVRPTVRSSRRSSARTPRGSTSTTAGRSWRRIASRSGASNASTRGPGRTNRRYGFVAPAVGDTRLRAAGPTRGRSRGPAQSA